MTNQVIVSNLPLTVSGAELAAWCAQVVPVAHAEVMVDEVTSRSHGVGLVTFQSVSDAAQAVSELRGQLLAGKVVTLAVATAEALARIRQRPV